MPRRRNDPRQQEQPYVQEPEGVASIEALYRNGIDAGYEHRAHVRQLNAARVEAHRQAQAMREPPLFSAAWVADQVRKSRLSGMYQDNQALAAENVARKREREKA